MHQRARRQPQVSCLIHKTESIDEKDGSYKGIDQLFSDNFTLITYVSDKKEPPKVEVSLPKTEKATPRHQYGNDKKKFNP